MTETHAQPNVDTREISKFDALAASWWDTGGDFKPLHDINPLRVGYISARTRLAGKTIADIGCGGGILSEALARAGARVTGIDMGAGPLQVARLHLHESRLAIDYRQITAEQLAAAQPGAFDVVTCLELLEHVPDPAGIVRACATLVKPGGDVFFSTINRTLKAYLFAVLGAEYLLRLLPRGTHDYARFIQPGELDAWCRAAGMGVCNLTGLGYNPLSRHYALTRDVSVNYLAHAVVHD